MPPERRGSEWNAECQHYVAGLVINLTMQELCSKQFVGQCCGNIVSIFFFEVHVVLFYFGRKIKALARHLVIREKYYF